MAFRARSNVYNCLFGFIARVIIVVATTDPFLCLVVGACLEVRLTNSQLVAQDRQEATLKDQPKNKQRETITDEDYTTFKAFQKIRDLFAQAVNNVKDSCPGIYMEDGRIWPEPNPYWWKTNKGILFQEGALWTPLF